MWERYQFSVPAVKRASPEPSCRGRREPEKTIFPATSPDQKEIFGVPEPNRVATIEPDEAGMRAGRRGRPPKTSDPISAAVPARLAGHRRNPPARRGVISFA